MLRFHPLLQIQRFYAVKTLYLLTPQHFTLLLQEFFWVHFLFHYTLPHRWLFRKSLQFLALSKRESCHNYLMLYFTLCKDLSNFAMSQNLPKYTCSLKYLFGWLALIHTEVFQLFMDYFQFPMFWGKFIVVGKKLFETKASCRTFCIFLLFKLLNLSFFGSDSWIYYQ